MEVICVSDVGVVVYMYNPNMGKRAKGGKEGEQEEKEVDGRKELAEGVNEGNRRE